MLARLLLALFLASAIPITSAAADSAGARAAVARIEVAVGPLSAGPALTAELAARQPWTPYQAELARRLRIGSSGTGFFVNAGGDLVTNAHVLLSGVRYRGLHFTRAEWDSMARLLETIRDVWVTVGDGPAARSYLAVPMAVAEDLDLAVLRVSLPPDDHTRFAFLALGRSGTLTLGAPVRALGFPENGYQETSGEILSLITGSAVHQRMNLVKRVDPATGLERVTVTGTSPGPVNRLQHSARVGHGSSGGPVLDAQGRVVGVAYGFLSDRSPGSEAEEGFEGLNLAIASDVLKRFLASRGIAFQEAGP